MGIAARANGCSPISRLQRRDFVHQAFFVFAVARRDVVKESWQETAREFKRRFNIGDEHDTDTLIRACSRSIRDFMADKTL